MLVAPIISLTSEGSKNETLSVAMDVEVLMLVATDMTIPMNENESSFSARNLKM
jgi:hypothetical protein